MYIWDPHPEQGDSTASSALLLLVHPHVGQCLLSSLQILHGPWGKYSKGEMVGLSEHLLDGAKVEGGGW